MKISARVFGLVVLFFLLAGVSYAAITSDAKKAGYHSTLYADSIVSASDDNTVVFNSNVQVQSPSGSSDAATKAYVDGRSSVHVSPFHPYYERVEITGSDVYPGSVTVDAYAMGIPSSASAVLVYVRMKRVCPSSTNRYGTLYVQEMDNGYSAVAVPSGSPECSGSWDWTTYGTGVVPLSDGKFRLNSGSGSGYATDWLDEATIYVTGYVI